MTTIQVRTDEKLKKEVQGILHEIGLDLSSAVNLYLRHIVITGGIPFEVRTANGFTRAQEKKMLKEIEWAKKHGKSYRSAKEMHDDILGT